MNLPVKKLKIGFTLPFDLIAKAVRWVRGRESVVHCGECNRRDARGYCERCYCRRNDSEFCSDEERKP